jgi:hypothetical protein
MTSTVKEYEPHPVSEIFSRFRMEGEELDALGADIKANGLKEAIWLFEDKILDGNNRFRACLKINRAPEFRQFDPKVQGDPLKFVVSSNLHRRHLTESQRATIAASLVTTKLGYNQYNNSNVTNEQAAKMLGVSEAIVKMAKDVEKNAAPEIKAKVKSGELRLSAAKGLIKQSRSVYRPADQQLAELNRRIKERADEKAAAVKTRAAAKANTDTKDTKHNQAMTDLDNFKKKWQSFNDMQRRGFVATFEDELANIIDLARQQRAMIGGVHQPPEQPVAAMQE